MKLLHSRKIYISIILLMFSASANATRDMRPLGILIVSMMCTYQNPEYRNGIFGRMIEKNSNFSNWDELSNRPLAQCLKKRQWVPANMCESVNEVNIENRQQLDTWFSTHSGQIKTLRSAFDFVNDVYGERISESTCPDIPAVGEGK